MMMTLFRSAGDRARDQPGPLRHQQGGAPHLQGPGQPRARCLLVQGQQPPLRVRDGEVQDRAEPAHPHPEVRSSQSLSREY